MSRSKLTESRRDVADIAGLVVVGPRVARRGEEGNATLALAVEQALLVSEDPTTVHRCGALQEVAPLVLSRVPLHD